MYLEDGDPEDRDDWPRQHVWLVDRLNELHRVFANRVKTLNAEDWDDPSSEDGAE